MTNKPKISEAEREVMNLLWERSPLTSNEIITKLSDKMDWSDQTIKTFLGRLAKKEAIRFEKSGRNYLYYPCISQNEYLKTENSAFLNKVYNGALNLLFSKFLEDENLSDTDLEKLQKILEKKKKGEL